jgi:hypothetical protein
MTDDDSKRPDAGKPHKTDPARKPTKDELDEELDEALEESFPASDPASMTRSTHPGRPNDKPRKR